MIISFKYRFIFIKNYKTAGSSIENYLYKFVNSNDIVAPTEDLKGINCWGDFNPKDLSDHYSKEFCKKKIDLKLRYFAHMPIWLIKKRLQPISERFEYDIFNNFYKFGVVRNPFDLIISALYWRKKIGEKITLEKIIYELEKNTLQTYGLLNLNRLMDENLENILCNKIIKYENLNEELSVIFRKLEIPFSGKLEIFKKRIIRERAYKKFFTDKTRKLVEDIFWKELEMFNYKF